MIENKIKTNSKLLKTVVRIQSIIRGITLRKKVKSGVRINTKFNNQENPIKYQNVKSNKIVRFFKIIIQLILKQFLFKI